MTYKAIYIFAMVEPCSQTNKQILLLSQAGVLPIH